MKTKAPKKGMNPANEAEKAPEIDPMLEYWCMLGERQYLMSKLAGEINLIMKKIEELGQPKVPQS